MARNARDDQGGLTFDFLPAGVIRDESNFAFEEDVARNWVNHYEGSYTYFNRAVPRLIHYGFLNQGSDTWEGVTDLPVEYDSSGLNKPVTVRVPASQRDHRFVYVLWLADSVNSTRGYWTEHRYINLTRPAGSLVCLPLINYGRYPGSGAQYEVIIWEARGVEPVRYLGKVTRIYYGFTGVIFQKYLEDRNPPWQDSFGRPAPEGMLSVEHRHDGLYKGSYVLPLLWVRVPESMNVVYKLVIEKYHRDEQEVFQSHFDGLAETQTYYRPYAY